MPVTMQILTILIQSYERHHSYHSCVSTEAAAHSLILVALHARRACILLLVARLLLPARSMRSTGRIGRLLRGLALDATNHIVIELKLRPYKRVRLLFAVLAG